MGRKNGRPAVSAIIARNRVTRDPERGRRVEVGFLGTDRIHMMKRDKVA